MVHGHVWNVWRDSGIERPRTQGIDADDARACGALEKKTLRTKLGKPETP